MRAYLTISVHFILLFAAIAVAMLYMGVPFDALNTNLHRFDVNWYHDIASNGYSMENEGPSNTIFFPLFALLWRVLPLNEVGISIVNLLIYFVSVVLILRTFRPLTNVLLVSLAIPSMFFLFIPYTEALFFLGGTLILCGFKKEKDLLVVSGLFIACLTRSASMLFIPVVLGMLFFNIKSKEKINFMNYLYYMTVVALSISMVFQYQYYETGTQMAFFKAGSEWDCCFANFPSVPFLGGASDKAVRLDSVALLSGLVAAGLLLFVFIKNNQKMRMQNEEKFALFYIAGISFMMLVLGGGDFSSLNRFVFATPFFFVFLHYVFRSVQFDIILLIIAFIVIKSFYLLFGSYLSYQLYMYSFAITTFLVIGLLLNSKDKLLSRFSFGVIYTGCLLMQAYYFVSFLKGDWIG